MATFSEDLKALIKRQEDLAAKIDGYMAQMATVVDTITYPDIPTGEITLPNPLGEAYLNLPDMEWPPRPDINYAAMGNIDKYKKHIWEGPYLDQAEKILMDWVKTGGLGISQAVQDATFNQDRERRRQTLRDSIDVLAATHGGAGFRYPNSRLDIKQGEVVQKYQFDDTQLSRTIITTITDLAQKNAQYALSKITDIEQLQADFSYKYSSLYINVMQHVIETYKADIQAMATKLDTEIRKGLAWLDSFKISNESEYKSAQLKATAEQFRLTMEMDRTKLKIADITQKTTFKVNALSSMEEVTGHMMKATGADSFNVNTTKGK